MRKNKLKLVKAKVQVNFNEILRGVKKGQKKENKDFWNTTNPLRKTISSKIYPKITQNIYKTSYNIDS